MLLLLQLQHSGHAGMLRAPRHMQPVYVRGTCVHRWHGTRMHGQDRHALFLLKPPAVPGLLHTPQLPRQGVAHAIAYL